MKKFTEKLNDRNNSTKLKPNNPEKKIKIDLKIFEENEKPQISYPFYYNRKQRYN